MESQLTEVLKSFNRSASLKTMKTEDIRLLPKMFILSFACNDIDDVWDNLPEEMQKDKDIMRYRRCYKHHKISTNMDSDDYDGPTPFIKNCHMCANSLEK